MNTSTGSLARTAQALTSLALTRGEFKRRDVDKTTLFKAMTGFLSQVVPLILALQLVSVATADTSYRVAYMAYSNGSAALMVASGELGGATPPQIKELLPLGGGIRGAGQLAPSHDGRSLALVSWRASPLCKVDPTGQRECWVLEVLDLPAADADSSSGAPKPKPRELAFLSGGAGFAGQPAWSSDDSTLAFISEAEADNGGSYVLFSLLSSLPFYSLPYSSLPCSLLYPLLSSLPFSSLPLLFALPPALLLALLFLALLLALPPALFLALLFLAPPPC